MHAVPFPAELTGIKGVIFTHYVIDDSNIHSFIHSFIQHYTIDNVNTEHRSFLNMEFSLC